MPSSSSFALLLSAAVVAATTSPPSYPHAIPVNAAAPNGAGVPLESFVSFSIEFSSFPDFAGNLSHPNSFSRNLLDNLGGFSGTKPIIRVGGNTQDFAIFDKTLKVASVGIVDPKISPDYPTTLTIGPAYFESYQTLPGTKFVHGFNLGGNSTEARDALIDSVSYACKALEGGKLAYWELGNEPDLFKTSGRPVRPRTWSEQDYVNEWLHWTRAIHEAMKEACPHLASERNYKYYAPSFAGTGNSLNPIVTWKAGIDSDKDIGIISSHKWVENVCPWLRAHLTDISLQLHIRRQCTRRYITRNTYEPHIDRELNCETTQRVSSSGCASALAEPRLTIHLGRDQFAIQSRSSRSLQHFWRCSLGRGL